jgi:YVTN family beta-propeller protein
MFLTAPVLTYDVNTVPFPLLASAETGNLNKATFTALATNATGGDVVLEGIVVQLPVGSDASTLTLDPSVIGPVAPLGWTLASTQTPPGFVQFVFHPMSGHATLPKGQSLRFVFNNIEVNRTPGTFALAITEGTGNCVPPDCPVYTTHITKFPNGWGQVSFWVSPANIPYQGSTTLFWSGPQGATYTIEYMANGQVVNVPVQGDPPLGNNGQYPGQGKPALTLETTTVFTMNVAQSIDNQEFHAQQQVTVSVGPPPPPKPKITKFNGSIKTDGTKVELTLSWITELADQITITNINGLQKPSDTLVIKPTQTDPLASTYTLEARKGAEAATSTISIIWTGYKSAAVGSFPWDCAILPNGTRLFATNGVSNSVSVLDPVTLANVPNSPFKVDNPVAIAASPDSSRVYINRIASPANKLSGYNSGNFGSVSGSPVDSQKTTSGVAVTPDSKRIYVSGNFEVRVFDASNMKQVGKVSVGNIAQGIAFTPDGSRAFVAISGDAVVSVIDTAKIQQIATIKAGSYPIDVAVTPDGKQLYVGNQGNSSVSVFDPVTLQQLPGSPIGVSGGPLRLSPSSDGRLMFVLSNLGAARLNVIDTTTRTLVGSAPTGGSPSGLAVSPDGLRVFVVLMSDNTMWMFLPSAMGGIG